MSVLGRGARPRESLYENYFDENEKRQKCTSADIYFSQGFHFAKLIRFSQRSNSARSKTEKYFHGVINLAERKNLILCTLLLCSREFKITRVRIE